MRCIFKRWKRAILVAVGIVPLYGSISVYCYHVREQRIVRNIEALGGSVRCQQFPPFWVPQAVADRLRVSGALPYD